MNKFMIAVAFVLVASTAHAHTNACKVPLPPHRPTVAVVPPVGAVIKDGMVVVRAPVGSDMMVDVDGNDIDVSIEGRAKRGFNKVLPWNWSIWK